MQLSEHFTLEEMTVSQEAVRRGLDNTPPPEIVETLKDTAKRMEEVRSILGKPIIVTSGYRNKEVNAAVRGQKGSAHMTGHAVDFICPAFGPPGVVCKALTEAKIAYDQLICEGGAWTHISFAPAMRQAALTATFGAGQPATYTEGIA